MTKGEAIVKAVRKWAGLLKFFPAGEAERKAVMEYVDEMTADAGQVLWLADEVVKHHAEWPGGLAVRGILCSRFRPRDQFEADAAPHVVAAAEQRYIEEHNERKQLEQAPADGFAGQLVAGVARKLLSACADCGGEGVRPVDSSSALSTWRWCACAAAASIQRTEPNKLEEWNQQVTATLQAAERSRERIAREKQKPRGTVAWLLEPPPPIDEWNATTAKADGADGTAHVMGISKPEEPNELHSNARIA